jgi:uncharacterized protein
MALMPSINLTEQGKKILLDIARQSIEFGLKNRQPLTIDINSYDHTLQSHYATFITLNINHQLRGCIGTLEAYQPLIKDVADHAYAAAFQDPRFSPVTPHEIDQLDIHISILTTPEIMNINSEEDLLNQLQPSSDGLILETGNHKATFLPAVWESLPDKHQFLRSLKLKAGLDANYWSDDIHFMRYQAVSIP